MDWRSLPEGVQIQYDGLRDREAEVVFFLTKAFGFAEVDDKNAESADVEFVNVNDQLSRILDKCFDINPDGSCIVTKSPWRPHPPTLVGSSKLMVRTRLKGQTNTEVRQLEAVEYWALQGWDHSWWITPESSDWWQQIPKIKNAHQFIDLCSNMTGNAFSAFHCIPMFLATLATMGRYSVLDVGGVVDSDDDLFGDQVGEDPIAAAISESSDSSSEAAFL